MAGFVMLVWDLSPATAHSPPPQVPQTPMDQDLETLAMFRACLLKTPHAFDCKLRIPAQHKGRDGEFQIQLRWDAAGDTCGIALWNSRDHTAAVSIHLNGLESLEDLGRLKGILSTRGFAMPDRIMREIDAAEQRPLIATLYYSRAAMQFKQLTGIIPLLARSYFDLFGTPAQQDDLPGGDEQN